MKNLLPFFSCLSLWGCLLPGAFCQDENLRYDDWVYLDNLRTVQLFVEGEPASYPIVEVGSNVLELAFDDVEGDYK